MYELDGQYFNPMAVVLISKVYVYNTSEETPHFTFKVSLLGNRILFPTPSSDYDAVCAERKLLITFVDKILALQYR